MDVPDLSLTDVVLVALVVAVVVMLDFRALTAALEAGVGREPEAKIREACNVRAADIQRDYCDKYVPTRDLEYREDPDVSGACGSTGSNGSPAEGEEGEVCFDEYVLDLVTDNRTMCSPGRVGESLRDEKQVPPSSEQELHEDGAGTFYFERTASEENCSWVRFHEASPVVTVEGDQYNCLDRGYINPQCPVR